MSDRLAGIIIGAGPAGLGPLVCALQQGQHDAFLDRGIVWLDAGTTVGRGTIGDHAISSDTAASVLLECVVGEGNPLTALADTPVADEVRQYGSGALPLTVAATFLEEVGRIAHGVIDAHPTSEMRLGQRATHIQRHGPDHFRVHVADGQVLEASRVVMALGGRQNRDEVLTREVVPGLTLGPWADRCVLTGDLFRHGGLAQAAAALRAQADPRVVVVGGSHSAVTAVHLLLESGLPFRPGSISLVYRREPKIFYPDPAAALADGYHEFDERDICPTTGRVFRLAGLRMYARDLMRRVWGLGGLGPEDRVVPTPLADLSRDALAERLDAAGLIVPAFGYRPGTVPVVDADGQPIPLRADAGLREPLVDDQCRVLHADGTPVPGLYGIGLASGFVPRGPKLGGEPSFDGQTNGLWLYQNGVGRIVMNHLLDASA